MASQAAAGPGGRPIGPQGKRDRAMEDLFNTFAKTEDGESTILKIPAPFDFTLRDTSQKVVRLKNNSLVAEASNHNPEKLSVVPNQFVTDKQYPIILGVQEGKLCLSCNPSAQPMLQLEEKEIMALVEDKEQAARFTFHNTPTGSTHRFESAANPGWFLCTSQKNSEPLSVTNQPGAAQITEFYFQRLQT
ncbi:interleukin-36 receptor antagonist protein-like [Pelodiscus sinensis]|uniref:interleukin-36 receptor antagonist protein-like n=1 Tax=Pelodiscus sinensis TaxID=13735 RepID=UPI003F6B33B2